MRFIPVFVILIFQISLSYGQFQGPGTTDRTYTVKEIKDNASRLDRMDTLVKVQGLIVMQISKDTYEFKDNTGTILVEIDKKKLPAKPFDDKTELILIGEVDHDMLEPLELEVEELYFVNP